MLTLICQRRARPGKLFPATTVKAYKSYKARPMYAEGGNLSGKALALNASSEMGLRPLYFVASSCGNPRLTVAVIAANAEDTLPATLDACEAWPTKSSCSIPAQATERSPLRESGHHRRHDRVGRRLLRGTNCLPRSRHRRWGALARRWRNGPPRDIRRTSGGHRRPRGNPTPSTTCLSERGPGRPRDRQPNCTPRLQHPRWKGGDSATYRRSRKPWRRRSVPSTRS